MSELRESERARDKKSMRVCVKERVGVSVPEKDQVSHKVEKEKNNEKGGERNRMNT